MLKKSMALLLATFAIVVVALAQASAIFAGQAQFSSNLVVENMVDLAQKAKVQAKSLIDSVYADQEALQKIADINLTLQLEANVSLYEQGVVLVTEAEGALKTANYSAALSAAQEAMQDFGQVLKSVNGIVIIAGLKTGNEVDAASLLDAISRTEEKIAHLRQVLPPNATDQLALLNQAEALLNLAEAENLISEGKTSVVTENLNQANTLLSQVYNYLKFLAEDSNAVRISGYLQEMVQARERIRERIGYAGSQGINVDEIFELLGYHSETEFMNALQNLAQDAQDKMGDLNAVIHDLEVLGQMVQRLNQTLTQEMNRHQNQGGTGGNGNNDSGNGSGPTGTATHGTGGTSGSGTSGTGPGSNSTGPETTGNGNGPTGTGTPDAGNNSPSGTNGTGNGAGTSGKGR